jgi:vancomycin resistance protein YoaR
MEPTGHYWLNLAENTKKSNMRIVLVNPHHVKKSKELDDNNPSKNDRKDPKTIAMLVKDGRYMEPYMPEGVYKELRIAMETRWHIMKELTAIKNRICRWISIYFPEFNKEKTGNILDSIIKDIEIKPKDAGIRIEKGKIKISPHENGLLADRELTLYKINKSLENRTLDDVVISVESVMPDITTEMVKDISFKLGEYYTAFNPENESRSHNIRTACAKISQKLLLPGQVFSMDKVLGERTEKNGYRTAKVIVGNELVDGLGGGICQVTSTVYNAVVLSGLEVVERRNHSIPLSYIEMGRDATISYGYIDFKFKNNSDYAVVIEAEAAGGQVHVSIWGKRPDRVCTVKIRTKIIQVIQPESVETKKDETLLPGENKVVKEEVPGYVVEVYRDTYDMNGNLIKTEKISVDRYQPQKKMIHVAP